MQSKGPKRLLLFENVDIIGAIGQKNLPNPSWWHQITQWDLRRICLGGVAAFVKFWEDLIKEAREFENVGKWTGPAISSSQNTHFGGFYKKKSAKVRAGGTELPPGDIGEPFRGIGGFGPGLGGHLVKDGLGVQKWGQMDQNGHSSAKGRHLWGYYAQKALKSDPVGQLTPRGPCGTLLFRGSGNFRQNLGRPPVKDGPGG